MITIFPFVRWATKIIQVENYFINAHDSPSLEFKIVCSDKFLSIELGSSKNSPCTVWKLI